MAIMLEEDVVFQEIVFSAPLVIYEVPQGFRAVIRSLRVVNSAGANRTFTLYMKPKATGLIPSLHVISPPGNTLGAQKMYYDDAFKALGPGWQILAEASVGGDLVVVAWGALIKL